MQLQLWVLEGSWDFAGFIFGGLLLSSNHPNKRYMQGFVRHQGFQVSMVVAVTEKKTSERTRSSNPGQRIVQSDCVVSLSRGPQ